MVYCTFPGVEPGLLEVNPSRVFLCCITIFSWLMKVNIPVVRKAIIIVVHGRKFRGNESRGISKKLLPLITDRINPLIEKMLIVLPIGM